MKAAIIGFGTVSRAHISALEANGVEVVAIYSSHLQGSEKAAVEEKYSLTVYSDLDEMLAQAKIELVSICSRPDYHVEQAKKVLKAKKHVILEKPMAMNARDAVDVAATALENQVVLSVCYECRYAEQFTGTKAAIQKLGEIKACSVGYFHEIGRKNPQFYWNIRRDIGGSSFLSAGCHALNFALGIMGDQRVDTVSAIAAKNSPDSEYEYPTHVNVQMKLADGSIVTVTSDIECKQPYHFPVKVTGENGVLQDNTLYTQTTTGEFHREVLTMKRLESGDVGEHPYQEQFRHVIDMIERGASDESLEELESVIYTHRIIDAIEQSLRLGGKAVKLTSFAHEHPNIFPTSMLNIRVCSAQVEPESPIQRAKL